MPPEGRNDWRIRPGVGLITHSLPGPKEAVISEIIVGWMRLLASDGRLSDLPVMSLPSGIQAPLLFVVCLPTSHESSPPHVDVGEQVSVKWPMVGWGLDSRQGHLGRATVYRSAPSPLFSLSPSAFPSFSAEQNLGNTRNRSQRPELSMVEDTVKGQGVVSPFPDHSFLAAPTTLEGRFWKSITSNRPLA